MVQFTDEMQLFNAILGRTNNIIAEVSKDREMSRKEYLLNLQTYIPPLRWIYRVFKDYRGYTEQQVNRAITEAKEHTKDEQTIISAHKLLVAGADND